MQAETDGAHRPRYSGSADEEKQLHDLDFNIPRKVMLFNVSAMTTTSDMPETSQTQMSRNFTTEDFEDDNASESDEYDEHTGMYAGGFKVKPHLHPENPPSVTKNFRDQHVYKIDFHSTRNSGYSMDDTERTIGSSHPNSDAEDLDDNAFRILPSKYGHPRNPPDITDDLDIGDDEEQYKSAEVIDDPLGLSDGDDDAAIKHDEESSTMSVEHVYNTNTDPDTMRQASRLCLHLKSTSNRACKGIWATIRHENNMDNINLSRRSSYGFQKAIQAYYVDSPEDDTDSFEETEVLPAMQRPCFPQEGNIFQRIYRIFDKSDTWTGMCIGWIIMIFIFISLVSMCMETLPQYRFPNYGDHEDDIAPVFVSLELISVVVFSVEYATRIYTSGWVTWEALGTEPPDDPAKDSALRKRWFFFIGILNMIDFLAIFPFYLEILTQSSGFGGSLTILRLLRLLRVLRLFKLGRHLHSMRLYAQVLFTVAPALIILLLFLTFLWVIGSSLMYIVESGTWDEDFLIPGTNITGAYVRYNVPNSERELSPFLSVIHSLWWAIATYSLVGYGEIVPASLTGYAIGIVFMILGIIALSLPIGLVATAYMDITERMQHDMKDDIEISRTIIDKLNEAEEKLSDLERMITNTLRKWKKRNGTLEKHRTSYRDVTRTEDQET